ncbi:MAG: NAD(+) synthase [Spirochaetales bacterium]|uniref:Glutamine-dependent NAD(+) synthetase n=1 Tax=Candidatus Thalassospirochaeta sargassi TaxID=3119039 RepID=A0AAJ1IB05_9SPIO|nr:NAD(+) synthase [Spirochaetales bacterium]
MRNELGFVRIGCVTPELKLADVGTNADSIIRSAFSAAAEGCDIIVYPELSITGYTCADLFHQKLIQTKVIDELLRIAEETSELDSYIATGLPVYHESRLYNAAVLIYQGCILGIVPKTYIPNYGEFYEHRWFSSGSEVFSDNIVIEGSEIPFGTDLVFKSDRGFSLGMELCEDMWAPVPPSVRKSLAGAEIILNLSASNELAGKADYRRGLIEKLSGQQLGIYAYCSSGIFESTTDTVFGGHRIIAENGKILAESGRFDTAEGITVADVDIGFIAHERGRNKTFSDCAAVELGDRNEIIFRSIELETGNDIEQGMELKPRNLMRFLDARPFVPASADSREYRCREIFMIQSAGLASRLRHIGCSKVVIGLSGGLDSTLALLVCIEAFKSLGLNKKGIICITMPGFGTTGRTRGNAEMLCEKLGLGLETVEITPAVRQHFNDIGHDESVRNITYENSQARERTQILMDKANQTGGIVIGTGDLSEQAMGWSTYNGDHMSMYAVNTGVPKTLVRFLVEYYIEHIAEAETAAVLADINATPISPELLPPDEDGNIAQKTEDNIGPYELHDFFLFQVVRCGFEPKKVLFLAEAAFNSSYDRETIQKWLKLFYHRFFSQQFKRSCVPDGPKVGTIALSPRADWRMPSDASVAMWLKELD